MQGFTLQFPCRTQLFGDVGAGIQLVRTRGINVNDIAREREKHVGEDTYEFDIIAIDGNMVVAVEAKTTLRPDNVMDFVKKMEKFKKIFPSREF